MRFVISAFFFLLLPDSVVGQLNQTTLSLTSLPEGAQVYIDSIYIGKAPLERVQLNAGKHMVMAFYPSATSWNRFSKTDSIQFQPGNDVNLVWEFGSILNLNSVPSGSAVSYNGRQIGVTPLFFRSREPFARSFVVEREGYEREEFSISGRGYFERLLRMKKNSASGDTKMADILEPNSNGAGPQQWVTYLAGSAMVVSGILAAYLKDRANQRYEDYQRTQDPNVLDSTHRLDRLSGISFTLTQISFGVLAYKLLLE